MKVKNITLKEYAILEGEEKLRFDYFIKYGDIFKVAYDHLKVGDFLELPFGLVKDIQYDFSKEMTLENLIDYFSEASGITTNKIGEMGMAEFMQQQHYFIEEITRINNIENEGLSSEITSDEEQAGIDRFNDIGVYLQFRSLANNDITKIEEIRKIKYKHCFTELVARKMLSDYEIELSKIKSRKYK